MSGYLYVCVVESCDQLTGVATVTGELLAGLGPQLGRVRGGRNED